MYSVPILKKTLDILRLLVEERTPSGVTEIAKRLDLSKSTTFGILRALEKEGFLVKESGAKRYMIGPGLIEFSRRVIRGADFVSIARPFIEKLCERVEETVFIGVREHDSVKVLDVVEAKKDLKISSPIGTRTSIMAGVFGKIFLCNMDDESVMKFVREKGLPRYTESSIVEPEVYLEAIHRTRERGYAVDLEEYMKGLRALATLIYSENSPVAALWTVGFSSSMSDDKLLGMAQELKYTAQTISERLSALFLSE
jgi:IclR family KDG regulon transcriptional repressor